MPVRTVGTLVAAAVLTTATAAAANAASTPNAATTLMANAASAPKAATSLMANAASTQNAISGAATARAWRSVAAPTPSASGSLTQVATGSKGSAFAVGTEGTLKPALYRWTGAKWVRTASPVGMFAPTGVAVASPANAWTGGIGLLQSVALHWNGKRWQKVSYLGPGVPETFAASSDGGAWSISGLARSGGGPSALLRWTGSGWASVSLPTPPSTTLTAISARSRRDVWVGGTTTNGLTVSPIFLHYNGSGWSTVAAPGGTSWGTPAYQNIVQGVEAVSPTSVWALRAQNSGPVGSALLHWNGRAWRSIPTPLVAEPLALAGDGHGGVWVAPAGTPTRATYFHWDGSRWTTFHGPARSGATGLSGLAAIPGGTTAWSVGATARSGKQYPLIERFG
jgi:hypothetical protein